MSTRVALLRLQAKGLIELPAPRNRNGNGRAWQPTLRLEPPLQPLEATLSALGPIELQLVRTAAQSQRWNSLVAQYHYLGHYNLPGAQVRYLLWAQLPVSRPGFSHQRFEGHRHWRTSSSPHPR